MNGRALACVLAFLSSSVVLSSSCALTESGLTCDDDVDNDNDGRVDCADTDCFLAPACQPCGDGDLADTEACDDGNVDDGDGCSSRCVKEGCGNSEVDDGEACDDGNVVPADGCNFRCEIDHCGDGIVQSNEGEECDDANALSDDGCSSRCAVERGVLCGNFQFDPGEQCDDGNRNDNDGCTSDCLQERCGDNIRQTRLGEQCDGTDVPLAQNGEPQQCEFCQIVRCGNSVIEAPFGEDCDDGNRRSGDGCSEFCRTERCGDFQLIAPEQCDDGNLLSGDGCSSTCEPEICGDGVVQPRLGELCDDDSADCTASCDALRACAAGACFDISRQHPGALPSSTALLRGETPRAVFGSLSSFAVFVYGVDEDGLGGGEFLFDNVSSPIAVRGADLDGDGADELLAISSEGVAGVFQLDPPFFERLLIFNDRVLDIGAADIGGSEELEVVAVSRTGELSASFAGAALTLDIDAIAVRIAGAPVRSGVGIVAASGRRLLAASADNPANPGALLLDGTLELEADVRDLVAADIDGDGVDELLVLTAAPDELHAVFFDGNGMPASATFLAEIPGADAITAADFDDDGSMDVVATGERATMSIHLAATGFTRAALPCVEQCTRASAVDVDTDGDVDILVGGGFFQTEALLFLHE